MSGSIDNTFDRTLHWKFLSFVPSKWEVRRIFAMASWRCGQCDWPNLCSGDSDGHTVGGPSSNNNFSFSSEEDNLSDFSCFTIFGHWDTVRHWRMISLITEKTILGKTFRRSASSSVDQLQRKQVRQLLILGDQARVWGRLSISPFLDMLTWPYMGINCHFDGVPRKIFSYTFRKYRVCPNKVSSFVSYKRTKPNAKSVAR